MNKYLTCIALCLVLGFSTTALAGHGEGYYHLSLSTGSHLLEAADVGFRSNGHLLVTAESGASVDGLTIDWTVTTTASAAGGDIIEFYNAGTNPITVVHHSSATGVTPANWISTIDGRDVTLAPGERIELVSDASEVDEALAPLYYTYYGWHEVIWRSTYHAQVATQPSRSIGTAWQPNMARATMVVVSLSATCALTLTGGAAGHIDVLVGSTSSPTTVIGSVPCANTGAVVVGVNSTVTTGGAVSYIVRPGDYVKVTTTNTTGTPTYTLAVTEETL